MITIPRISVGEAATIINAIFFVVQTTFALALVALFAWFLPSTNSAVAWSVIARKIHSSLWLVLLRSDSTSSRGETGFRFGVFSVLFFLSTALVSIGGLVTPLGLNVGPPIQFDYDWTTASYVTDLSPIGRSSSPRDKYTFGRICGAFDAVACPGNGENGNTSEIAPSTMKIFTSTTHGTFNMQFRRYYGGVGGRNYSMTKAKLSMGQSLILRDGMFAISGLVVDMTSQTPGIGLWNHTLPDVEHGGVWSQDMLWLEPVTECVNTNLTIDYALKDGPYSGIYEGNLTDHGGFANLTTEYPYLNITGQQLDLHAHAYKGAVLSNFFSLLAFGNATHNMTRNESYIGKTFPLNFGLGGDMSSRGDMIPMKLVYLTGSSNFTQGFSTDISCQGYGGGDNANITNIGVQCSLILGIPQRSDGGDPLLPADNSTWTQTIHACASATRARLQKVHFSFNGTRDLTAVSMWRENINTPSLWATERTDVNITDIDLFWGRVDDAYESDPSLSTIRSDVFYVPAGASDTWGVIASGQPASVLSNAWSSIYDTLQLGSDLGDLYGATDFATKSKFQSLAQQNPADGPSQILNLIWTNLAANNLVGTNTNTSLFVARNEASVSYDWRYGIPLLLLLILWIPTCIVAFLSIVTGRLKMSYMRQLLNHTSAGRIVTGHSALRLSEDPNTRGFGGIGGYPTYTMVNNTFPTLEKDWEKTAGQSPVALSFSPSPAPEEQWRLMKMSPS